METLPVTALQGYLHPLYPSSLQAWGEPLYLPQSQGWLLRRPLPDSVSAGESDYSGLYPFFRCLNPQGLAADLADLPASDLTLVLVSDPLGPELPPNFWPQLFPDHAQLFKLHWGVDFQLPLKISAHHRYYARKALRSLEVERLPEPLLALEPWCNLYDQLIRRHGIQGLRCFSREAFALQLQVPGLVAFAAKWQGEMVAMHLWVWESSHALVYSHLAASSELGYHLSAPYALYLSALEWFRAQGVRYLDLGGEVRTGQGSEASGLGFFKRGWANREQPVWLCGKILNAERYAQLTEKAGSAYFPAYRRPE